MFYYAICFAILLSIVQIILSIELQINNPDKYGPYVLKSVKVESCRGPKLMDQAILSGEITENEKGAFLGSFYYNSSYNVKLEEAKLTVYTTNHGKKSLLFNHKYIDPCKHYLIGTVITIHLKTENCVIKKGLYKFDLNITDITITSSGKRTFYGTFSYKVVLLSKKGNCGCLIFYETFEKKT